jgi:very-short-patch-repair endonuclease
MSYVLRTIEAFPRGRTTGELLSLLDVQHDSRKRVEILREIEGLARDGVIRIGRDMKWRSLARQPASGLIGKSHGVPLVAGVSNALLQAIPAKFQVEMLPRAEQDDVTVVVDRPDPNALLRYYRSALRSDPRGALTQTDERHGISFQLVTGNGDWTVSEGHESVIRIQLDHLPGDFREALFRREANENALAIGWPIAVGRKSGAPAIWPVGLLAATWERGTSELIVRLGSDDVLVNPDWVKAAARTSAWSEIALREAFQPAEGTGLPREEFLLRLNEAMARTIRGTLRGRQLCSTMDPQDAGIFDALALFLPNESSFTAGAVRDIDAIAAWPIDKLGRTALAALFGIEPEPVERVAPSLNVGPLNAEQIGAVISAMSFPLTVVTGPPGTGKSQAIVAMVASAIVDGQSVVVASKNHQALDAVQDRLAAIAPDAPFMVRTLDPKREIDASMSSVLDSLVREPANGATSADPAIRDHILDLVRKRAKALSDIQLRRRLQVQTAEHIERLDAREAEAVAGEIAPTPLVKLSLVGRILLFLRLRKEVVAVGTPVLPEGASANDLRTAIRRDRESLAAIGETPDPVSMTNKIAELAKVYLPNLLSRRAHLNEDTRFALNAAWRDIELSGKSGLSREVAEQVILHRPLWLASVLGTPKRIPLHEGLFDLVIFDEASQCDIASALPLMARAKRVVVVGDDRQLAFISQLGAAQDRNLMAAQGLPSRGMGRFAQGRVSLFDLARSTPNVPAIMLRDQYRSATDIVGYINHAFYGGRLRVSADLDGLKVPRGAKPGLAWSDIPGRAIDAGKGRNINSAEIDAIIAHLSELLIVQEYAGSIGVIAPFRSQVLALQEAANAALPPDIRTRAELRVATVDGFQGQEKDLILFSPTVFSGSPMTGITFLQRDWRRLNVAISRAKAVAHVFGDLSYARSGKISSLATLAARATEPRHRTEETVFDSEWERVVYHALRTRGLDPQPQYDIAGRRLDFALFGASGTKLDLEVDGRQFHQDMDGHRKVDDHWRDHQLRTLGWKVRRFWVDELKQDMERCIDIIERDLA